MISEYTINQIEPISISTTKTELLAYLRTLNFISVNENSNNICTICFDDSPKSTSLQQHLYQCTHHTTPQKDYVDEPVYNLKHIIIKEDNKETKALYSYLKTLLLVKEVEKTKEGYTNFSVDTEDAITCSLVDYLKQLDSSLIEIGVSSPGEIDIERRKKNPDDNLS